MGKLSFGPTTPEKPSKSLLTDPGLKMSEWASRRMTKPFFFPSSEDGSPLTNSATRSAENDLQEKRMFCQCLMCFSLFVCLNVCLCPKHMLKQGFSNFFGWRPHNLSEKSRDPQGILRPSKCEKYHIKNPDFCHVFSNVSQIFLLIKFGDPFLTIDDPQKGRDP